MPTKQRAGDAGRYGSNRNVLAKMDNKIVLIPVHLFPDTHLPQHRWKLLPGLCLARPSQALLFKIKQNIKKMGGDASQFEPNFVIRIVPKVYDEALKKRTPTVIEASSKVLEIMPIEQAVEPESLGKLVLMALFLLMAGAGLFLIRRRT